MRLRLGLTWRAVARRAWSIRLGVLAVILSGLEIALPLADGLLALPQGLFAALAGLTSAAALAARLMVQSDI